MGGLVPLGYDCVDHRLLVSPVEAKTVREIFREYLRLGCVRKLKNYLETAQIRSKVRVSSSGRKSGGACYSRGALHYLLNNRVYTGHIVHRGQAYPGQHESIIEQKLWGQVAARLRANDRAHRQGKSHSTPSLLVGILRDSNGVRYTPTHAVKKGKRYRYYTSETVIQREGDVPPLARISAPDLEAVVGDQIRGMQSLDKFMLGAI
jgi:site-specific DNA recombinase